MAGPPPAVARVRHAVRSWLTKYPSRQLWVAVSGGADSVALLDAVIFQTAGTETEVHALTVDHQLQPGSAGRAADTAALARTLGARSARVLTVEVGAAGGLEAAARSARYAALDAASDGDILLGHTLDDQAESVLLGLGRGSGGTSIHGMAAYDPPYGRPLLEVRRTTTCDYCRDRELPVWDDPHNQDRRFTRVRLRHEVLPLLEEVLGGGVAEALARTGAMLRADAQTDAAAAVLELIGPDELPVTALEQLPAAFRGHVIKAWLTRQLDAATTSAHVGAVEALVSSYRGQGPAYLPGGSKAIRERGKIRVVAPDVLGRAAPAPPDS